MKEINDNELERLISQSLQRQHIIEKVNATTLAQVKRLNRVRKVKKTMRIVIFAFGIPLLLAVMGYGAYNIVRLTEGAMGYIAAAITIISALGVTTHSIVNFSLEEV